MKKIEKLDYNTSVYPPHIPRLQTVIEKVQELIDAHNELAKIVGLLLKRDEENCLEKAKAELLETHTVKEECEHQYLVTCFKCGATEPQNEEPATPEKKRVTCENSRCIHQPQGHDRHCSYCPSIGRPCSC